ncbi:hypothetical protein ACIGCK_05485 [Microbacterium sp. NPDC078428]|uniref:hypothetical protein n=1 Tax=Microbacterium sp. NPDC078428 TaxID=3364190 RepID=UPI0037CB5685
MRADDVVTTGYTGFEKTVVILAEDGTPAAHLTKAEAMKVASRIISTVAVMYAEESG